MAKGVKTGGRKKGTPNRSEIRLRQELEAVRAKLAGTEHEKPLMALDLLQQVYRNASHELTLRLQAAAKAIVYETPALATHKHDATDALTKTAQMFAAAAQTLDEKVNAVIIAARSTPTEDAAVDAFH